jgi:hypothetical protein
MSMYHINNTADMGALAEVDADTMRKLKAGEMTVMDPDQPLLRCPLTPNRDKLTYRDLLHHCTTTASDWRGRLGAAQHKALQLYLERDLTYLSASPSPRPKQTLPLPRGSDDMLVLPWSVVVYNINKKQGGRRYPDRRVMPSQRELRRCFKAFSPVSIDTFPGPAGISGVCVLRFDTNFAGLRDALALDRTFHRTDNGLRDLEKNFASWEIGEDWYGWIACEDDFRGRRWGVSEEEHVAGHLRSFAQLTDIASWGREKGL